MTAKRFTLLEDTNGGLDTVLVTMVKDNGKFLTHKECCDLLNEQYEQIKQLKSFVEYEKRQHKHWKKECLENIKEIAQLKREIVQLKEEIGDVE